MGAAPKIRSWRAAAAASPPTLRSIDARFEASVAAAMRGLLGDDRAERASHAAPADRRGRTQSGANALRATRASAGASAWHARWRAPRNCHRRRSKARSRAWSASRSRPSGCQAAVGDRLRPDRTATARASRPKWSASRATVCFSCPPAMCTARAERARGSAAARRQRARRAAACWAASSTAPAHRSTGSGRSHGEERVQLHGQPINPLARHPIDTPLDVGVRAINALLTVGRGQRIGLFAGTRRRQERAARHDGALHQRRRDRRRPDRRARPRSEGIRRAHPRPEGPPPLRRRRGAGRQSAADAPAGRVARDVHRRVLPRPRQCTCCCSWIR